MRRWVWSAPLSQSWPCGSSSARPGPAHVVGSWPAVLNKGQLFIVELVESHSRTRLQTSATPDEASLQQHPVQFVLRSFRTLVASSPGRLLSIFLFPAPLLATSSRQAELSHPLSRRSRKEGTMWFKGLTSALCLAATALGAVSFDENENIRSISVRPNGPRPGILGVDIG